MMLSTTFSIQPLFLVLLVLLCRVNAKQTDVTIWYQFKGQVHDAGTTVLNKDYLYGECIPAMYSKHPADYIFTQAQATCFAYRDEGCKGSVLDNQINLDQCSTSLDSNIIKYAKSYVCIEKQSNGPPPPACDPFRIG